MHWTEQELKILLGNYTLRGAIFTQKRLAAHGYERSISSIRNKASRLMVWRDAPQGYIPVMWVAALQNRESRTIIRHARKEGVLKDTGAPIHRYFVPDDWTPGSTLRGT